MNKEAVEKLRGNLTKKVDGFNMSASDFEKTIQDSNKRNKLYNNMRSRIDGFTMSEEEFNKRLGFEMQDESKQSIVEAQQEDPETISTIQSADVVGPSKRTSFWKSVFAHNPYPASVQEQKEKEEEAKAIEEETRSKYLSNLGAKQPAESSRGGVRNFADFGLRTGIVPTSTVPTVGEILKKVGDGEMTESEMREQISESKKLEDKAKENMGKVRQEYAQEVYDRRYKNINGTPKDSFFGDMFDAAMAGIGTIAATPFKLIESAENFGIDIDNAVRGTNMQHGQGVVTRFFDDVLGIGYLRGQIEHYTKEADRYQDNKGIVETAFDGELGTAAGKAVLATIQSAPNLAVSIYSGKKGMESFGGVFLGTTAALQKYDEIKDNEDISSADKALAMFGAFVSECVPEIIGAKRYGKFFNQKTVGAVRKETRQEVLNGWQKFVNSNWVKKSGLAWDWFMKYFGEGTTEAMTDIMNLGIDLALGIKDEVTKQDLMSIGDSFIVGQLSDIGPSSVHYYQQNKYKGIVEREINNNPMLSGITQQLGTTPDKIAEISSKRMFQENVSDKEAELFNNYQEAIGKRVNEIKGLSAVIEEAGLKGNPIAYLAYNMAAKELSIEDGKLESILIKPAEELTEEDSALLKNLSSKMSELAGTEELAMAAKGRSVPRTMKSIIVSGPNGRRTRATVFFEGEGVVFNDDGSIDAIHSNNLSVKNYRGEEIKGDKRAEWIESLNAVLRNEFSENAAREEIDKLAKQRAEDEKANKEIEEQKKEQARRQMIADISKDIPMDGVSINAKKATPAQTFVWNLQQNGQEEAMSRAARSVGRYMLELEVLKETTTMLPEEQDAAIDKANIRIAGYKDIVSTILGEQSLQQLEHDSEGIFAQLLKERQDAANEEERARLERIAEKQRRKEENRTKYQNNLQDSEKSSTFAQNSEGNDNTGVQQSGERGNQAPQPQSNNEGLGGDRGAVVSGDGGNGVQVEPEGSGKRYATIDSLSELNREIDSKLSEAGINFPAIPVVQVNAQDFHDAIVEGRAKNEEGWRVDVKDVSDYEHCICILTEDGSAGIAVTEDGDIVSLFSDKRHPGIYKKMLLVAIAKGGRKADFFMSPFSPTGLQNLYWRFGLRITGQNPFDIAFMESEYGSPDWVAYRANKIKELGDVAGRRDAENHPLGAGIFPATIDEAIEAYVERRGKLIENELGGVEAISEMQDVLKNITIYPSYDEMMAKRDEELANEIEDDEEQDGVEPIASEPVDLNAEDVVLMVTGTGGTRQRYVFARKSVDENGNATYTSLGNPFNAKVPKSGKKLPKNWGEINKETKKFYVTDSEGNPVDCYALTTYSLTEKKWRPGEKLNALIASTGEVIRSVTSMPNVFIKNKDGVDVSIIKGESKENQKIEIVSVASLLDYPIVLRRKFELLGQDEIAFTLRDLLYSGKFEGESYVGAKNNKNKKVKMVSRHPYSIAIEKLREESRNVFGADRPGEYTKDFNNKLKRLFEAWNNFCKENGLTNLSDEQLRKLKQHVPSLHDLFWSARLLISNGNPEIADKASLEISTYIDTDSMSAYMRNNPLHQLAVMLYIGNVIEPGIINAKGIDFSKLPSKSAYPSKGKVKNVQKMVTKKDIERARERYTELKSGKATYNINSFTSLNDELETLEFEYPEVLNDSPVHNRPAKNLDNAKNVDSLIHDNKVKEEAAKKAAIEAGKTDEEREAEQYAALEKTINEGFAAVEKAAAEKDNDAFNTAVQELSIYIEGNESAKKRLSDIVASYMASLQKPARKSRKKKDVQQEESATKTEEASAQAEPAQESEQIPEQLAEPQTEQQADQPILFDESKLDGMTETQLRERYNGLNDKEEYAGLTPEEEAERNAIAKRLGGPTNFNINEFGGTNPEYQVSTDQRAKSDKSRLIGTFLTNVIGRIKGPKVHVLNSQDDVMRTLAGLSGAPEFMSAYHGSSAKFSRFDHSHMGEGEGTQFEGWGTYVSLVREVSEYYARLKKMGGNDALFNGERIYPAILADKLGLDYAESQILLGLFATNKNGADIKQILKRSIEKSKEILQSKTSISDEEYDIKFGPSRYREEDIKEENKNISLFETILEAIGSDDVKVARNPYDSFVYSVEIPDKTEGNYFLWDKKPTKEHFERINSHLEELGLGKLKGYDDVRGEYTYKVLAKILGSQENASKFLHECSFVGIEAPVGFNSGLYTDSNEDKNYVIFDENDIKIKRRERIEYLKTPEGTIYGFAIGDEIYITPEGLNADTPIHEYTHLWVKALRISNPKAWEKIVAELKRNKSLWESVTNDENYKDLVSDDAIASEVLARYSGKKGGELLEKLAIDQKFGSEKLEEAFLNRVRKSLRNFWQRIAELLHININNTKDIDSIADWVLRDLFDGRELDLTSREILEEMDSIKKDAIKNGTFMKAPNGKTSNLQERQWLLVRTKAFKKWFGDWENDPLNASKVVDENGEPLVVYHGTHWAGFGRFAHPEDWYTKGFYTTDNRMVASGYTNSNPQEIPTDAKDAVVGDDVHEGVYSLFLNIRKPLYIDFADKDGNKSRFDQYHTGRWVVYGDEERGIEEREFGSVEEAKAYAEQFGGADVEEIITSTDAFANQAASMGFDGCIFTNVYDGNRTLDVDMTDYVALNPNQLKSVNNKGYFSTLDDRIEYQYTLEQLNEHNGTATAAVERASELASAMGDVLSDDGAEQSRLSNIISKCLDQMEGMRLLQDSLAAYRRTKGEEPLPDKYDIRNKFESKDTISMNKIRKFNHTIAGELNEVVVKFADVIKDSEFYKKHKKEVGGEKPTTLTCVEFIGRYLIARNDYERAKEGVARGMATFEQRMGMSTEQFWREFQEAYDQSLILELWDKIKVITNFELETAVEGGLITREEFDRLMAKPFYVPQRGFWDEVNPENEEGDNELRIVRNGGKSKIELSSMKKAKGGKSLAENPLVYIYRDAQEAIIKSENNKVKVALYDMLRENSDWCAIPEVGISVPATVTYTQVDGNWEKLVNGYTEKDAKEKASLERRLEDAKYRLAEANDEQKNILLDLINELDGQLAALEEGRMADEFSAADNRVIYNHKNKSEKRNTIGVLIDGIQHEITLPKKFILTAQAFNGVSNKKGALDTIRTWSSFMAAQFTVNNPTFWSVNLVRDIGFVTLKGGTEYGWEFERRFYHYLRTCQKSLNSYLWNGVVNDNGTEEASWLQEFLEQGGNTGLFNNLDLEKFRYDVRKMNPEAKEGNQKRLSRLADIAQWAMLQPVANYLNEWSELTSRFAIFCAIKKMGMSTNEAVKASHNLSVNFNRRGLGWELLNAFSSITVFVNATLQGSSGFWRTFGAGYGANKTDKIKRALKAGCVMASLPMFLGAINAILLPDDDDEEKRISDWDRDNYFCLPNGFKIAIPQEIRPFWCMGSNISLIMSGSRTWRQAISSILKSIMTNAMPIPQNFSNAAALGVDNLTGDEYHNTGEILRTIFTPSFMETLGQIAENKNFLGGKLRYDFKDWPEYEMAPNESIFYRDLSYAAYRVGGGDPDVASKHRSAELGSKMSQLWDINPKQIKPLLFFIPSGTMDAWVTLWGGGRAAIDAATGNYDKDKNYVQWKDAVIANRFYRPINKDAFRYVVKKQAKAIIDEYDAMANNAKDNIVRNAALGNTKKEEAAIKRYQQVLLENAGIIEEMKVYQQELNAISRRALQNRLKLMNDSELKDVVGIESYNTLDEQEKEIIEKLVYDIKLIQGLANPPQDVQDIKVIE